MRRDEMPKKRVIILHYANCQNRNKRLGTDLAAHDVYEAEVYSENWFLDTDANTILHIYSKFEHFK